MRGGGGKRDPGSTGLTLGVIHELLGCLGDRHVVDFLGELVGLVEEQRIDVGAGTLLVVDESHNREKIGGGGNLRSVGFKGREENATFKSNFSNSRTRWACFWAEHESDGTGQTCFKNLFSSKSSKSSRSFHFSCLEALLSENLLSI